MFVVRKLAFAVINLHTKFEVSMFTHYEDMKGNAKYWISGGLRGIMGDPRSPAMSPFDRASTISYSTLIETMRLPSYSKLFVESRLF